MNASNAEDPDAAPRARALALRQEALRRGQEERWFEALYRGSGGDMARVFWADQVPNPNLTARWEGWRVALPRAPRVLVIGAGFGDDAAWMAARGARVWAFDLSPSAVGFASQRFRAAPIHWFAGDLHALPLGPEVRFDLVLEVYTLQVIHPERRGEAMEALASRVAPGGELWVIARGRPNDTAPGDFPWPLGQGELTPLDRALERRSLEEFLDDEEPPARRLVARYGRPGAAP